MFRLFKTKSAKISPLMTSSRSRARCRWARPVLEVLEDRTVPAVLFNDTFDNGAISARNWSVIQRTTDDVYHNLNPPSPYYSALLSGTGGSGASLVSRVTDLSAETGATLSYYYERTGSGTAPGTGNDLVLEYLNAQGQWVELDRQLGSGPNMTTFTQQTLTLPTAALNSQFQFRFRTLAPGGNWYIDNVKLTTTTGFGNYWDDLTWTGDISYPNTATFTYPNTATPTGSGSLTITANVPFSSGTYLSLSAEGNSLGNVFVDDGRSYSLVQATVPISLSLLQTLAADGSIQVTVSPSLYMYGANSTLTVRLEYPVGTGYKPPTVDLNGPATSGNDFTTNFKGAANPTPIVDPTGTVTATLPKPPTAEQGIYTIGSSPSNAFAVHQFQPGTGQPSTILTAGGNIREPTGVALASNGDLVEGEFSSPYQSNVSVVRINPLSGSQEVFSTGANSGGGIAVDRQSGAIYISTTGGIVRVDPVTGAQTSVGGGFANRGSISVAPDGSIIYGGNQSVTRLNPQTGAAVTYSGAPYLFYQVNGTASEASGQILAVSGPDLVQIDPNTGTQKLLSQFSGTVMKVIVSDAGAIYVLDASHNLFQVDPTTGQQTPISIDFYPDYNWNMTSILPDPNATAMIRSATITLTNPLDGSAESLAANTTGTAITANYNGATGILSLSGTDTAAHYQQVIQSATYQDSAATPNHTARQITFVVNDGTVNSNLATTTVNFTESLAASAGGPYTINEGNSLSLDGSGSSDSDGDTLTYSWAINGVANAATGVKPTLTWTQLQGLGIDDGPATFNISVKVDDGHGNVVTSPTTTLTLNTTAPTASVTGPNDGFQGVSGQLRTFTLGASEPSTTDQNAGFTYKVNWGDGSAVQTFAGLTGIPASHTYGTAGAYTVSVTATDVDGLTGPAATVSVNIAAAQLQGANLAVGGGPANNQFTITPGVNPGDFDVTINGVDQGIFHLTGSITLFGQGGTDTATINGTANANAFTIDPADVILNGTTINGISIEAWHVNGLAGNDTFTLHTGGVATIDGGGGTNSLIGANVSNIWNLTGVNSGQVGATTFVNIENLTGGTNNDTFKFNPGAKVAGIINGGGNGQLDYSAYGSAVTVNLQTGAATGLGSFSNIKNLTGSVANNTLIGPNKSLTWNITSTNAGTVNAVNFSNFANLGGGTANDTFVFSDGQGVTGVINGGGGIDKLDYSLYTTGVTVDLSAGTATGAGGGVKNIVNITGSPANDHLTGNGANNVINGNGGTDVLRGFGGNNTFLVSASQGAGTTIDGGPGNNTLVGANIANTWNVTGANAGNLNGISFTNIRNLTGGSSTDVYKMTPTGSLAGIVNGGGGANTLDYSALTAPITVNLQTRTANAIGSFTSIGSIVGSSSLNNTLIGPNSYTTWSLTGPNAGKAGSISFSGIENLTGGTSTDIFKFAAGASLSGVLDGGAGANTLDYSAYGSPVTVNLQTQTATAIGSGFANLGSLVGSGGSNTLIAANTTNAWQITATNAGKVGFFSFFGIGNLKGGTGNDTFKFSNAAGITGTLDGGGGSDSLDYSSYTTGVTVDLLTGTATGVKGGISNIQNITGSANGGDILVGDANPNILTELKGHNILIGGGGADTLNAGSGGDILIGGTTAYDSNLTALQTILATWKTSTPSNYASVLAKIMSSSFADPLNASTVFDDGFVDVLNGGKGTVNDWFFAHVAGSNLDIVNNLDAGETVTGI